MRLIVRFILFFSLIASTSTCVLACHPIYKSAESLTEQVSESPNKQNKDIEYFVQAITPFSAIQFQSNFGFFGLNLLNNCKHFIGYYQLYLQLWKNSFPKLLGFKLLFPFHEFV